MSIYGSDIKMVGRKESLAAIWAKLRKKIDSDDPTPLIDLVYLGCTQRAATIDEASIKAKTELFPIITTSDVDETLRGKRLTSLRDWSYEMQGHAEQCVEIYCDLDRKHASQLEQAATLCIDDHQ